MTAAGDATTVAGGCGTADCDRGHRNSTLAEGPEPAVPVRPVAGPDLQRRTRPRQGHAGRRRPCPRQRPGRRRRPHHRAHAPGAAVAHRDGAPEPDRLPPTMARVGRAGGAVFAEPPDARRDLPNDLPATDRTCTLTAWAENDDDEVIGPVASPALRSAGRAPGRRHRHQRLLRRQRPRPGGRLHRRVHGAQAGGGTAGRSHCATT